MQKFIRIGVIIAGVWSLIPWGLAAILFLLGALLPDPGSIVSFKVPWWAVLVVWALEPLLWFLLLSAQKSKTALILLTAFVTLFLGLSLWKGVSGLIFLWLGPTLLLLPLLFWRHGRVQSP